MKKSTRRGLITSLVIAIGTGAAALAGFFQDMTDPDIDIDDVEETKNESNEKTEDENPEDKGDDQSNTDEVEE